MSPTPDAPASPAFPKTISREALAELPIRRYEGPVRVIAGPAELEGVMPDLRQERVLGFDTETRPAFRPGERYLPSLAQFATANAVYLVPVQLPDVAAAVREILSSADIVKAGVSVADDLRGLAQLFPFEERSVVDLGRVAKRHGLQQTGVRNLAGLFLGIRIPKGAKTTNWAARQLTAQQVTYAATDAWACRELYLRFQALRMVE